MSSGVSPEILEILARRRRFSARSLHVAKRLLVDLTPAREVATEFGMHLSRIYAIRKQIVSAAQGARAVPAGNGALSPPVRVRKPLQSDGCRPTREWTASRGPGGSLR